jgi:hypothetical protein
VDELLYSWQKEKWATDIQIGMDGKGRWIDNA